MGLSRILTRRYFSSGLRLLFRSCRRYWVSIRCILVRYRWRSRFASSTTLVISLFLVSLVLKPNLVLGFVFGVFISEFALIKLLLLLFHLVLTSFAHVHFRASELRYILHLDDDELGSRLNSKLLESFIIAVWRDEFVLNVFLLVLYFNHTIASSTRIHERWPGLSSIPQSSFEPI